MYPQIYSTITNRLQDSVANINVAGGALDSEISEAVRQVLQSYNLTYADVEGATYPNPGANDFANLNSAIGRIVCIRMLTPLSTGGLDYDITGQKLETVEMRAAATPGKGQKDVWWTEAQQFLALISFVTTEIPVVDFFDAGGPKRPRYQVGGSYPEPSSLL